MSKTHPPIVNTLDTEPSHYYHGHADASKIGLSKDEWPPMICITPPNSEMVQPRTGLKGDPRFPALPSAIYLQRPATRPWGTLDSVVYTCGPHTLTVYNDYND